MDVDTILKSFNEQSADYILIGGMNFLLNHAPVLTFDVDLWIRDTADNRNRSNAALKSLNAEWGATEVQWKIVPDDAAWLERQSIFCLTSVHGPIDLFREVKGLEGEYAECSARALRRILPSGIPYLSLCDDDMLRCQLALERSMQKQDRIRALSAAIKGKQP